MFKKILTTTIIAAAAVALTSCSTSTPQTGDNMSNTSTGANMPGMSTEANMSDSSQEMSTETSPAVAQFEKIIDVRTLEEWNQGHIQDAVRISIQSPDFTTQLEQLDKTSDYFIYCRSGNRAQQAIGIMRDLGFTGELVNGGSLAEAASILQAPVVQ